MSEITQTGGYLDVVDATLRAPRLEATSNIGIANTNPEHAFSVGSNLYVDTESSNVITVRGNVVTQGVKVGTIEIVPSYDLAAVSNVGNVTANTIIFTNETQGFVATGNATIGSTLTISGFRITAAAAAEDDLEAITTSTQDKPNAGDTTNAIRVRNGTESTSFDTGALQVGTNTGANGGLGVAGNVHVAQGVYTQDLSVSGDVVSNLAVNTDDLFVDIVNSRVGIGVTTPTAALDVVGNVAVDTNTLFVDSVNNKVGIGVTEPGATLEVTGNAYVSSNLEVGTANLFVDTVNSRVGIGTTSLDGPLHIFKDAPSNGDTGPGIIFTRYANTYGGCIWNESNNNLDGLYFNAFQNSAASNHYGETPGMVINSNGNVGIGTINPMAPCHVSRTVLNTDPARESIPAANLGASANFPVTTRAWFGNRAGNTGEDYWGLAIGTIYSGSSYLQNLNKQNSSYYDVLLQPNGGNVGIGMTNPTAKFHVTGGARIYGYESQSDNGASDAYFVPAGVFSDPPFTQYSLYLQYWCRASGYTAMSDSRIKNNIVDVDDSSALETLRALKPKYYNYVDTRARGSRRVIGFLAQEVKEVCPDAVTTCKDYIPNIYELATVSDSNVITFTNFNTSNLESNATVVNTFGIGGEHRVNIVEVVDEHTIRVEEDLSEWTGSVDETGNVVTGNQLFVYGQEVDDFHNLNKDTLFSVATASLQEIDRQLQAEKVKVTTLETQLASVLARLDALESA